MGGQSAKQTGPLVYEVKDSQKRDSETPTYRNIVCLHDNGGNLYTHYWAGVNTLWESFMRGVENHPKNRCWGIRKLLDDNKRGEYEWKTYEECHKDVLTFASGLVELGVKRGANVGIYSINRPEWLLTSEACYAQSFVPVPLYDTLGPEAVAYIAEQAEIELVVCSVDKIPRLKEAKLKSLKTIISMDPFEEGKVAIDGVKILTLSQVMEMGREKKHEPNPPKPEDLCTICYTSGTTGNPKGVMLLHKTMIAELAGCMKAGIEVRSSDVHISYLPLAHIYEKMLVELFMANGASIGFYSGQVLQLFEDIGKLRPTIFASVPRLFNRVYDKIRSTVKQEGGMKASLFERAYRSKLENLKRGQPPESFLWDTLVFKKVRARLGGRVRVITSGAAPLAAEVHDFLRVCFCCPVIQGYGLTETAAASAAQRQDDLTSGNVGAVFPSVEMKLVDVPEMNYWAKPKDNKTPPRGEVCYRGPSVFVGYYKAEDKTKEAIDDEGWFHTGDIGQINPNGSLSIIDRKKNIFKLAQGEYVAAEYLEGVYVQSQFVQQIFVYGDSLKSVLVAIVVPKADNLKAWAKQEGIENHDDLEALCKSPEVKKKVLEDMTREAKEHKLKGFEFVKNIYLEPNEFTVESDLITPTFKLKRPQLKEKYFKIINDLYEEWEKTAAKEEETKPSQETTQALKGTGKVKKADKEEKSKLEKEQKEKKDEKGKEEKKEESKEAKEEKKEEKEAKEEKKEEKKEKKEEKETKEEKKEKKEKK
jgi:long-chain acyl-CoA synthetase